MFLALTLEPKIADLQAHNALHRDTRVLEMLRFRFLGPIPITDQLESVSADTDIPDHSVKSINSSIYCVTVAAFIYLMILLTKH